ncbi:hypothetical protein C8R46DRAFT_1354595 [Mycena filopes]|nr:hypothetical protein C8R46DRAFT_1354595 [Mycena filopes]
MPPESQVSLNYLLYDKEHWHKNEIGTILLSSQELPELRVAELMKRIQEQHNSSHHEICGSTLFVVSAWRTRIPLTGDLPDPPALQHNPTRAILPISFLQGWSTVSEALLFDLDLGQPMENTISLVLDFVYILPDIAMNPSSKRLRVLDQSEWEGDARAFDKQPKLEVEADTPLPIGVYLTPPLDSSAARDLPVPGSDFLAWGRSNGLGFVDKTRYIAKMNTLLVSHRTCRLAFPSANGKTGFASMMTAWYDCRSSSVIDELFLKLDIGKNPASPDSLGRKKLLCLSFNFPDIADVKVVHAHLWNTAKNFVLEYATELGVPEFGPVFKPNEGTSIQILTSNLFRRTKLMKHELFITVDNCDGPILACLAYDLDQLQKVKTHISTFIGLIAQPGYNARVLVIGQIPLQHLDADSANDLVDISHDSDLKGAFGMSDTEVANLSSLFITRERLKPIGNIDADLAKELGHFCPIPLDAPGSRAQRWHTYNFTLVLHHIATTFKLASHHKKTPRFPLLSSTVSRMNHDLLIHLRRVGKVFAVLIPKEEWGNLLTSLNNEDNFWSFLYYIGALKIVDFGDHHSEILQWGLELSSPFAASRLFSRCPPTMATEIETEGQMMLREFLDRRPKPLATFIGNLLMDKPIMDLRQMSEATLQAMVDTCLNNREHYFAQLPLLLDHTKPQGDADSGEGRYGYADSFATGPRRAGLMELKYFSLDGFIRADCWETKRHGASFNRTHYEKCHENTKTLEDKAKFINGLSDVELRNQLYSYYDKTSKQFVRFTVGTMLIKAERQLRSYAGAIKDGIALDYRNPHTRDQQNGVQNNPRVDVEAGSHTLAAYLGVGFGARFEMTLVETSKTEWAYKGKKGWKSRYRLK